MCYIKYVSFVTLTSLHQLQRHNSVVAEKSRKVRADKKKTLGASNVVILLSEKWSIYYYLYHINNTKAVLHT